MTGPRRATRDDRPVARLLDELHAAVAACGSAVVAYSGGIDSTLVLAVAARALGGRAVGVLGVSPSVAPAEVRAALDLAAELGVSLRTPRTGELEDPRYVANGPDRCFHCKTGLYAVCRRIARAEGLAAILNGTNADDPGDWRPGLVAADVAGVRSPLLECGLGKPQVRAAARALGLPNWDKPALACLASRLPYGTPVTADRLAAVDAIESYLRDRGFRQVRARHHGQEVRLEVEPERVEDLLGMSSDPDLLDAVRGAGFSRMSIEREGYRSGRLNDVLDRAP